jgi:hypothetical protein
MKQFAQEVHAKHTSFVEWQIMSLGTPANIAFMNAPFIFTYLVYFPRKDD